MERTPNQPERKYPQIDPELRRLVDAITCDDRQKQRQYYAFFHEIVWYGVDAVFHVQFTRDALEVAAGRMDLDELVERYRIHKDDDSASKFTASLEPLEDAGIYVPAQRTTREVDLFGDDYLNICGFPLSTFRMPKETMGKIFRKRWNMKDFTNPELMREALNVAKNLWAINAVSFDLYKNARRDAASIPPDEAARIKKLIEYYWSIVEAPDGQDTDPGQWMAYRRLKHPVTSIDSRPQIFIGEKDELIEAMGQYPGAINKCDPDPEILLVLRAGTRQELAEALIDENILMAE